MWLLLIKKHHFLYNNRQYPVTTGGCFLIFVIRIICNSNIPVFHMENNNAHTMYSKSFHLNLSYSDSSMHIHLDNCVHRIYNLEVSHFLYSFYHLLFYNNDIVRFYYYFPVITQLCTITINTFTRNNNREQQHPNKTGKRMHNTSNLFLIEIR